MASGKPNRVPVPPVASCVAKLTGLPVVRTTSSVLPSAVRTTSIDVDSVDDLFRTALVDIGRHLGELDELMYPDASDASSAALRIRLQAVDWRLEERNPETGQWELRGFGKTEALREKRRRVSSFTPAQRRDIQVPVTQRPVASSEDPSPTL